ncbi:type IV secretion system DNA-binding domain-containing protein [Chachezhania sediminis]|uniref:type IV secretion system DNA-binding domain-containing protein n=1 Tax=Chachezhania sediminis TaxID=2599291 RepID=UPI00131A76F5|nr:type IV secretion system DNA-binding domain-containing protein [Chachezhania sediminis]
MATQVLRYSVSVAAAAFTLSYAVLVLQNYEIDKIRLTGVHWLADFHVNTRGNEDQRLTYVDPSGERVERTAGEVFSDPDLRHLRARYIDQATRFAWIAAIPAALAFALVAGIFLLVGRKINDEEHVRGARLVSQAELKHWSTRKWRKYAKRHGAGIKTGPRYTLAGIPFPPNAVEAQIGITGTVGVGKTNAMHELLNTIRDQGGRAIVYDRMGGLLRDHYDAGTDVIVNPFDNRSLSWSPFHEAVGPAQFAQIAEVMIPDPPGTTDPFWTQAARLVFQYAARELKSQGRGTNAALREAIMQLPAEKLAEIVKPTPGAHFFGESVAKTSASIRANMISLLSFLEYLRDDAEPFSIREWVIREEPGFVFLTGSAEHGAATRNIISTMLEVAANALMTMEECRDPRLWFFLDEVPTLNRMPFLPKSLAEIRQFGGAFVVGYQVFSQLESIYGLKDAETISGVLNNRVVFNTPDHATAMRSSNSLGEEDVVEIQENLSFGANETRDGVSMMGRRTTRPIVTAAEIQSLPQFKAYFRPAYDAPAAKVTFLPVKTRTRVAKFVPYQGTGFAEGSMEVMGVNADRTDGQRPLHGFAAIAPDEQLAEFTRWLTRARPQEKDEILGDNDQSRREWFWQHFSTERVRGLDLKDIGQPDPFQAFAGSRGARAKAQVVRIPFPGSAAVETEAHATAQKASEQGTTAEGRPGPRRRRSALTAIPDDLGQRR